LGKHFQDSITLECTCIIVSISCVLLCVGLQEFQSSTSCYKREHNLQNKFSLL